MGRLSRLLWLPRLVENEVTLTALVVDETKGDGFTAQLTLECLKNGTGSIYPAPAVHAFLTVDAEFQGAIDNAIAYAKAEGLSMDGRDLRWRLQPHDNRQLPLIGGPSIGLTFTIASLKLLAGGAS